MLDNDKNAEIIEAKAENKLEKEINRLENLLAYLEPEDEAYSRVADNLKRLTELKSLRNQESRLENKHQAEILAINEGKRTIDVNAFIQGTFMLVGMGMCMHAEAIGNITTKAFSFVPRFLGIRRA